MRSVAKKFLTHREVSAQEAVYRLLSLPLTQGSREIVFLHTDFPENRTRLFKPMSVIQSMDNDDPDVFQVGLLNRYQARPDSLNDLCLASFASQYRYSCKPKDDTQDSDHDNETEGPQEIEQKYIHLKNSMGKMVRRKKAAVVRSHQCSVKTHAEQYYHAQLILYHPWRTEIEDLFSGSYQDSYFAKIHTIQDNRQAFEQHTEEVTSAIENLEEFGPPEDSWDVLAPQTEQFRTQDMAEGPEIVAGVGNAYDTTEDRNVARDIGIPQYEYELTSERMSNSDWHELILSLNTRQTEVLNFIVDWCTKMMLTHRTEKPPQFHIFLTGGAGVGKSHLVRTIVQTVSRLFS